MVSSPNQSSPKDPSPASYLNPNKMESERFTSTFLWHVLQKQTSEKVSQPAHLHIRAVASLELCGFAESRVLNQFES